MLLNYRGFVERWCSLADAVILVLDTVVGIKILGIGLSDCSINGSDGTPSLRGGAAKRFVASVWPAAHSDGARPACFSC
jgi:hypothetical protein